MHLASLTPLPSHACKFQALEALIAEAAVRMLSGCGSLLLAAHSALENFAAVRAMGEAGGGSGCDMG